MCFGILKKKPAHQIPHPEEVKNKGAKVSDVDVQSLFSDWFVGWEVMNQQYFLGVRIDIIDNLYVNYYGKVPAATYSQEMRMEIDAEWANAGVLAHEMAHISWFNLLSENHKAEFFTEYNNALMENDLLRSISSVKPYMRTGAIFEKHADTYRYMGQSMPEKLKQFYPNLI